MIESEKDYPSTWAAITAIAPKIGCTPETLRAWHQKHLDQQNPIKVQQLSDQERIKQGLARSGYKPTGKKANEAKHKRIKELLAVGNMTKEEIAKAVNCGVATVYRVAKVI